MNTILAKVKEVMLDDEILEEILEEIPKNSTDFKADRKERISLLLKRAGVTLEDYIEALQVSKIGYSIVLQRDIDELYQNPFNDEWLFAWNGNMDIQICLGKLSK